MSRVSLWHFLIGVLLEVPTVRMAPSAAINVSLWHFVIGILLEAPTVWVAPSAAINLFFVRCTFFPLSD